MLMHAVSYIQTQRQDVKFLEHRLEELQEKYDKTAEGKEEIKEKTVQAIEKRRRDIIGELADRGSTINEEAIGLVYGARYGKESLLEAQKYGIAK